MRAFWAQLLRVVHVFGAITAVGPTLAYGMWQSRGERAGGGELPFALRTTKWVDDRLATPALWSQVVTGVALAMVQGRSLLHTAWILTSLVLLTVMGVLATLLYLPASRRQIAAAERLSREPGTASEAEYASAKRSAAVAGVVVFVLTLTVLLLMILKPALWSAG